MSEHDVDGLIAAYHRALVDGFLKGDPEPVAKLYSRRDDVTLANPLGPPRLGRAAVETALAEAAANFRGGDIRFEPIAKYVSQDLGYLVQLERYEAALAGGDATLSQSLRVTMIFRREGDEWKVCHRHADTVTTARSISSIIEQ